MKKILKESLTNYFLRVYSEHVIRKPMKKSPQSQKKFQSPKRNKLMGNCERRIIYKKVHIFGAATHVCKSINIGIEPAPE